MSRYMQELLCGCREKGDIRRRCRASRQLLRATAGRDPLDPYDAAWNAYRDHYTDPENPPVQELRGGRWVPL